MIRPYTYYSSLRQKKNYVFIESTQSLCSTCLQVISAKVIIENGKVYLRKWCPEHGFEICLTHSDADWYLKSQHYNRPGDIPIKYSTPVSRGCPHDCGLCPEHEQHTCLGIIDITDSCNLKCPICYADSGNGKFLSLKQISAAIDGYIANEGGGGVIQFSGGEPTIHPQLVEAVDAAIKREIDVVMINTNGIVFSHDEDLIKRLRDISNYKLEVYLQFDGFSDSIYRDLRGADLYSTKMQALENLIKHGVPVNLASTIKRNTNEADVGRLVEFGVETKGIRGIHFQPASFTGRYPEEDILDRVTNTEIMDLIEDQTGGMFRKTDFLPLPCSHPSQISLTYAYIRNKKVKPIPRFIDMEPYLDQFTNTIYSDPRPIYEKAMNGLWSAGSSFSSMKTLYDFSCVCGIPIKKDFFSNAGRSKIADENAFRIILIQFQDRFNWDMKIARKSCVGFVLPDGRTMPFDTYNVLYRNKLDVKHWATHSTTSSHSKQKSELTNVIPTF